MGRIKVDVARLDEVARLRVAHPRLQELDALIAPYEEAQRDYWGAWNRYAELSAHFNALDDEARRNGFDGEPHTNAMRLGAFTHVRPPAPPAHLLAERDALRLEISAYVYGDELWGGDYKWTTNDEE